MFHIYSADCIGQSANCLYPHEAEIATKDDLITAVKHDYVCAKYSGSYRSNDNFICADCLPVDCDNDHSDDPENWIYPSDVASAFPDVAFAVHYSRNHMKVKNGKAARPKFHVFFLIDPVTDAKQYSEMKQKVCAAFPFFDSNALDAARFFFGTQNPEAEMFDGPLTLNTFFADDFFDSAFRETAIPEGSRNATLSHYAGRILKRYGNTEEAKSRFLEISGRCDPPLEQAELNSIWRSAVRFFKKVSSQSGYIPPELYNSEMRLKPPDYSDVGQALILAAEYEDRLRYSTSTDFLVYNGSFWEESKPKAQAIAQELTARQLEEAESEVKKAADEMHRKQDLYEFSLVA